MPVMGLVNGTNCWCGALMPPNSTQVDDSNCSTPCGGIDTELCTFYNQNLLTLTLSNLYAQAAATISGQYT
jgi:cell wall integrity and stress response component